MVGGDDYVCYLHMMNAHFRPSLSCGLLELRKGKRVFDFVTAMSRVMLLLNSRGSPLGVLYSRMRHSCHKVV